MDQDYRHSSNVLLLKGGMLALLVALKTASAGQPAAAAADA